MTRIAAIASRTTLRALVLLPLLSASGPARADHAAGCAGLPDPLPLGLDRPLRLGDREFRVFLDPRPAEAGEEDGGPRAPDLEIGLLARWLEPRTRRGRSGTWVPGLRVTYRITSGDGEVVMEGPLDLGLSGRGPAYRARVSLDDRKDRDASWQLLVSIQGPPPGWVAPRGQEGSADHGTDDAGQETRCDLPPRLVAGVDLGDLLARSGPEAAGSLRMAVVGSLDPRAPDNYSDVWGYFDGTTYLAIIGSEDGTSFIDVTDPAAPVEVGFVLGPTSDWRDIKTYGDTRTSPPRAAAPAGGCRSSICPIPRTRCW